ncbi:fungal-specific transcription factor domain-containing protein [Aspergillus heterothallicus]
MAHRYCNPVGAEMSTQSVAMRRQRRSIACDECRRRKLRCDGQQPQCGICSETGVSCQLTPRATRGPKKGHLRDLKNRLLHLESMLEGRFATQATQAGPSSLQAEIEGIATLGLTPSLSPSVLDAAEGAAREPSLQGAIAVSPSSPEAEASWHLPNAPFSQFTISGSNSPLQPITRALHDELDQLYMDRVHLSIPILHQRRYLVWSKSPTRNASRRCLQYAMWTLAALLSTQFRDMVDTLYGETKRMLENLTADGDEDKNSIGTELAQASVLVVTFESMRTYHRRAWMSAGRAFRLVQAMHYHEIDDPADKRGLAIGDFIEVEEKRRVFWMAYFLDHIISLRDDWPITLNEHVICTRLPAPDTDFQNGVQKLGPLLSEAMTDHRLRLRSPFNECLVLATICGRSLLQSQQYQISKAYGGTPVHINEQQRWLDELLSSRLQVLSQWYPAPTKSNDPLLVFAHSLAQATELYHCKSTHGTTSNDRALKLCEQIISLAKLLPELPMSKIHPLMPMPLFLCAEYLYSRLHDISVHLPIQELFRIFSQLRNVNDPEQSYLDLLPRSCLSKTAELAGFRAGADVTSSSLYT